MQVYCKQRMNGIIRCTEISADKTELLKSFFFFRFTRKQKAESTLGECSTL